MLQKHREELDAKAVEIDFLVISIIQGFAIQFLASAAVGPLSTGQFEYWPYIVSGFILILIFWTQAVTHALSFIKWPIDIVHTFLYLLASFFEVMAFSHVANPFKWFVFGGIFLLVTAGMYIYDLSMIKRNKGDYDRPPSRKKLFAHMYTEQVKEMKSFIPASILYSISCIALIYFFPGYFITRSWHVLLSVFQAIFSVVLLVLTIKTFKERSRLIEESF